MKSFIDEFKESFALLAKMKSTNYMLFTEGSDVVIDEMIKLYHLASKSTVNIAQQTLPVEKTKLPTDIAVKLTAMIRNMKDLPPKYESIIEDYFWDLT